MIRERLPDGPPLEVIVNRFEQRLFGPGLRRADIEQALGESLAGTIPNNFRLVSEAIDRGVPLDEVKAGNNIAAALSKLIVPPKAAKGAAKPSPRRRAQARAGALRHTMFGRFTASKRIAEAEAAASRGTLAPRASFRAVGGAEPADGRGAAQARTDARSPRRRSRRCATSCSTPRCGCIAG